MSQQVKLVFVFVNRNIKRNCSCPEEDAWVASLAQKHKFIKGIVGGLDLTQVVIIIISFNFIIITKNFIMASVNNLVKKNKGNCKFIKGIVCGLDLTQVDIINITVNTIITRPRLAFDWLGLGGFIGRVRF